MYVFENSFNIVCCIFGLPSSSRGSEVNVHTFSPLVYGLYYGTWRPSLGWYSSDFDYNFRKAPALLEF